MCSECMYSMKMYVSLTIEFVGLMASGFVCYGLVSVYVDLSATVSCVHNRNASTFITSSDDNGLVIFKVVNW